MANFLHSQYFLCSVFYKVKTFSICAICYEKVIHLSIVQAKLSKNLFQWCQHGFDFHIFFIKISREKHSINVISSLCSHCRRTDIFFVDHQPGFCPS